jgi:hypothetical protein
MHRFGKKNLKNYERRINVGQRLKGETAKGEEIYPFRRFTISPFHLLPFISLPISLY